MTQPSPQPETTSPPPSPFVSVVPVPESRLDQLAARYEAAKERETEAKAELTAITDGIKTELTQAHPGARELILSSPHLTRPLQLQAVESRRLDTKAFKATMPAVYEHFLAQCKVSWTLRTLAG